MRIGLISDTHIAWEEKEIPRRALELLQGVDLILHGGDIYAHRVLDDLEAIAPVYAALGDDDYASDDARIKEKHIFDIEGKKIWLIHEGPYLPLGDQWITQWWQNRTDPSEDGYGKPDIIVSGHEHRTFVNRYDGIVNICSGSPNLLHYRRGPGTIGFLEINDGKVDIQIINL
jgi:putative phosphoesterase